MLQSIWLHILGQETVVAQKKITMAIGYTDWGASLHCISCWHCRSGHDYRYTCVDWAETAYSISLIGKTQAKLRRSWWRCCFGKCSLNKI